MPTPASMTVATLKKELGKLKLVRTRRSSPSSVSPLLLQKVKTRRRCSRQPTSGVKAVLVKRLEEHFAAEAPADTPGSAGDQSDGAVQPAQAQAQVQEPEQPGGDEVEMEKPPSAAAAGALPSAAFAASSWSRALTLSHHCAAVITAPEEGDVLAQMDADDSGDEGEQAAEGAEESAEQMQEAAEADEKDDAAEAGTEPAAAEMQQDDAAAGVLERG